MKKDHDITDKQNRNIFLDDFRDPSDAFYYTRNPLYMKLDWIIVRNYEEFISDTLKNGMGNIYSFDHDLADVHYNQQENPDYSDNSTEKTGYHCAKWLIEYAIDNNIDIPEEIYVHSMNTVGSINIKSLFKSYKKIYKK